MWSNSNEMLLLTWLAQSLVHSRGLINCGGRSSNSINCPIQVVLVALFQWQTVWWMGGSGQGFGIRINEELHLAWQR